MAKVCVIGHFGGDMKFCDGQTIKTKNVYNAIESIYLSSVTKIDTYNWKKNPIRFFIKCIYHSQKDENIIMLPAHNGVKIIIPMFTFLNKFKHKKLFYVVIGGWLPNLLNSHKKLLNSMKKLNTIFVETKYMKEQLEKLGLNNVEIMLNFKRICLIKLHKNKSKNQRIFKTCIFSRIIFEKGIEDAIDVITKINNSESKKKCTLDIYGPIGNEYKTRFEEIIRNTDNSINYKGIIDNNDSIKIIRNYDCLLFPTKFMTEGLPGTIIDSYFAGVPVVASNWNSAKEFIINHETGYIYNFNDKDDFYDKMVLLLNNKEIYKMKKKCIDFSSLFQEKNAIVPLIKRIK